MWDSEKNRRGAPFLVASVELIYPSSKGTALGQRAIGWLNGASTASSSSTAKLRCTKHTPAPREPRFVQPMKWTADPNLLIQTIRRTPLRWRSLSFWQRQRKLFPTVSDSKTIVCFWGLGLTRAFSLVTIFVERASFVVKAEQVSSNHWRRLHGAMTIAPIAVLVTVLRICGKYFWMHFVASWADTAVTILKFIWIAASQRTYLTGRQPSSSPMEWCCGNTPQVQYSTMSHILSLHG